MGRNNSLQTTSNKGGLLEALEKFRAETREWLEANCPASMRTPLTEEEAVFGGRKATIN